MENIELSITDLAVLGLLARGEQSGYELWQASEGVIGELWRPARSQLYKVLGRLEQGGFTRARDVRQQGRPDKRLFRLAARGEQALADWLAAVDERPAPKAESSLLKVFFADLGPPGLMSRHLRAYRRAEEGRLAALERAVADADADAPAAGATTAAVPARGEGGDVPDPARLIAALGMARARAGIRWADDAVALVEGDASPTPRPSRRAGARGARR